MDNNALTIKAEEYISLEEHPEFRRQVEVLLENEKWEELNDRFFTDLTFGTGGLRGVIGGGYNRMNPFVVRRATQGLASYIRKAWELSSRESLLSAVIAYDSRNYSDLFALEAARVLCGNGITTYLFPSLRPTPQLSFALRALNASAGIVVTASHNPPEYNGYKVYWSDGAQVVSPHDAGIIAEVVKVSTNIEALEKNEAEEQGLLRYLDSGIDDDYVEMVKSHVLRPGVLRDHASRLKIVYTPLHGTGALPTERVLTELGFSVHTVPEQREPDGNFPTVDYPNPEEASAMKMAVDLGKKTQADIVMGTDPDADRLGIAVPDGDDYRLLTGNQLGALLADYIFCSLKEEGRLPARPAFIKTIVTTELQSLIAESYGAEVYDVLTGFKYIGEKIGEFEKEGITYLFGGEESYGYLVGTEVRDKDAVSAAAMTAEMALYNISRGRTVLEHLNDLYIQHGYFEEVLISKTLKGEQGIRKIKEVMESLRSSPPKNIGSMKIAEMKDYLHGSPTHNSDLPSSNVLQFITDEGTVVSARPSGTEPKIKFYASCRVPVEAGLDNAKDKAKRKLDSIRLYIQELTG